MASKAVYGFSTAEPPAQRFFERSRNASPLADCEVQVLNHLIVAHTTFIKYAAVLKNVCLTCPSTSEAIENRFGYRIDAIADGVNTPVSSTLNLVRIRPFSKCHSPTLAEHLALACGFQSVRHRSRRLSCSLTFVALSTCARADITNSVGIIHRPPV